jgi:hypothetical protein
MRGATPLTNRVYGRGRWYFEVIEFIDIFIMCLVICFVAAFSLQILFQIIVGLPLRLSHSFYRYGLPFLSKRKLEVRLINFC